MLHGSFITGFINKIGSIYIEHAEFMQVWLNKNVQAGHFAVNRGSNGQVKAFFDHVHFANAFAIDLDVRDRPGEGRRRRRGNRVIARNVQAKRGRVFAKFRRAL